MSGPHDVELVVRLRDAAAQLDAHFASHPPRPVFEPPLLQLRNAGRGLQVGWGTQHGSRWLFVSVLFARPQGNGELGHFRDTTFAVPLTKLPLLAEAIASALEETLAKAIAPTTAPGEPSKP